MVNPYADRSAVFPANIEQWQHPLMDALYLSSVLVISKFSLYKVGPLIGIVTRIYADLLNKAGGCFGGGRIEMDIGNNRYCETPLPQLASYVCKVFGLADTLGG